MKSVLLASAILATLTMLHAPARADDLSPDTVRMLAYGTTAVEVGVCNLPITDAERKQMMTQLSMYAERQKDLTQEQFTEAMKAAGAQIGQNKEAICAQIATQTMTELLADDEAGK